MEDKIERKSNGMCKVEDHQTPQPCITIEEQPHATSHRFRYECEGRLSGKIPGKNHTDTNPTYPTFKIDEYTGNGKIKIWVSCVTVKRPYRVHPYWLIGDKCKNGIFECYVELENMRVTLANVGICCIKRKQMKVSLRLREEQGVDPFGHGFDIKNISPDDLNSVRLCIQGDIIEGDNIIRLNPVVSDPIYDKKSRPHPSIVRLSHSSAPAVGEVPIIILCTKVVTKDIEVIFFKDPSNRYKAEVIQIHNQTAIVVKTPKFTDLNIDDDEAVDIHIQLHRRSDNALSKPIPFRLTPASVPGSAPAPALATASAIAPALDTRPRKRPKMETTQHSQTMNESSTESNPSCSWYPFYCNFHSKIAISLQQQNHEIISDDSSDIENDIPTGDLIDSEVKNLSDYVESISTDYDDL